MATKYKSKNRLALWWAQASKQTRILTGVGVGILALAVLAGLVMGVRAWLDVTPAEDEQTRTTIQLPAQGLPSESETPSADPTPELPPVDIPTPTETPTPMMEPYYPPATQDGGSVQAQPTAVPGTNPAPTASTPPPTRESIEAAIANLGGGCQSPQPVQTDQGLWIVHTYADWGNGDFQKLRPCLETLYSRIVGLGVGMEVSFQAENAEAAYFQLDPQTITSLRDYSNNDRAQQFRYLIQLQPGYQLLP